MNMQSPVIRAAAWMSVALASFTLMAISARELSSHISVFQILVFRSFGGLLFILPFVFLSGLHILKTRRPGLHLARHSIHFCAQYSWFLGLTLLPLAEVFALEFTAPIWVIIIAAFVLKEQMTPARLFAVIGGFLGVLIIIRPGVAIVDPAAFIVLFAGFGFACSLIFTKILTRTDAPVAIIFYMALLQTPLSLTFAYSEWIWPGITDLPWILLVAITGNTAHYGMARALQIADASVIFPMDFLRVPLITLVGFLIYQEALDFWVLLGACVIFGANYWLILRESSVQPPA